MLKDKTIVLGITGGIAAYKAADLASKLTQAGASVETVMTGAATKFVTPLTLRNITGRPVVTDMFEIASEYQEEHIALAEAADVVVVAPATANTIARLSAGIADNMLGTVVLATRAPVIIAPAMNDLMYSNPVTQENLEKLRDRGFTIIEPERGRLASGKIGKGRLPETARIIEVIERVLGQKRDLEGRRIVVTAGGTREPIDPVRHIGNRSSGRMGYALVGAARDRGASVTLVAANVSLPDPGGVEVVKVGTAAGMKKAVAAAVKGADALIMAAAVSDYRPKKTSKGKIKKEAAPELTIELERTPDILSEVRGDFVRVGFAAESEDVVANARRKLAEKKLDLIVANDITAADAGFDVETNRVTLIDRTGLSQDLPLMSKREVAERVLDRVGEMIGMKISREGIGKTEVAITVRKYMVDHGRLHINLNNRTIFPQPNIEFELILDQGKIIKTYIDKKTYQIWKGTGKWVKNNLKSGNIVKIEVIEPMKKYRLEIVK